VHQDYCYGSNFCCWAQLLEDNGRQWDNADVTACSWPLRTPRVDEFSFKFAWVGPSVSDDLMKCNVVIHAVIQARLVAETGWPSFDRSSK
jgi:hypothetical protein